ncbi:MAG: ABC transporter ATP-binding protein [Cenarchaeum sp. SB0665_bin_23]|nr:ABC transporter ATP-binding protein [Cenarchaeum sp. SB0667_bin_13]MXY37295.1 ABC transporter ATP-binding protein [Cenarchaeum sp. SB0664_bin_35]MXY61836.1 ABC transporter ATP-binding protein [Cenarchaeum sp. SB0665_bin_23]MXZ93247.1 ABC transporter ATP-binding protein [Cenarchaeum sp. SB0666_bin_15]MYB46300.1 ABC transporter ATP-binding protein [Cenarchaeum sp. SB0662_bin_33]MYC79041.1 ABC transporter ATP-binding protein [Cenarchaeum sp. SB0661_bin_35]MYD58559.1 ABC transporter ATP-bindin
MDVQVCNVSKKFGEDRLMYGGVNLTAKSGDFICITGPSGCGKTTLLRMIAGFESPDDGSILIDGHPVEGPHGRAVMVFQEGALFPWLNVRSNIEYGLQMHSVPADKRAAKSEEMLQMMNLGGAGKKYLHELSTGMKQRVAIARALALDPSVLLMDEPFSALDYGTRITLMGEMYHIWARTGKTVLFVTHHLLEAVVLGSRIIQLSAQDGRITHDIPNTLPYPRDPHDDTVVDMVNNLLEDGQR